MLLLVQFLIQTPCDPSVRERYYAEITAIREQNERLRVIYAKVQDLKIAPVPPKP